MRLRLRQYSGWYIGVILALVLCIYFSKGVKADSLMDVIYTSEDTHENYAEAYAIQYARGAILEGGYASIGEIAVGKLNLFGSTQAFEDCSVTLKMYLERKTDSTYYTYRQWNFHEDNTCSVGRSINILVPRDCFYRLKTYHAIEKDGIRESAGALTLGIYID